MSWVVLAVTVVAVVVVNGSVMWAAPSATCGVCVGGGG